MKLKEYRINSKLTQIDVAKQLNITQAGYGNYETGRTQPDIETLKKLSKIFNTSIDNLVDNVQKSSSIDLSILSKRKQLLIKEIINADNYDLEYIFDDYIERNINRENHLQEYNFYKNLTLEESEKHLYEKEEKQINEDENK